MQKAVLILVFSLAVLAAPQMGFADTVYTYTGTSLLGLDSGFGFTPTPTSISMSFDVSDALAPTGSQFAVSLPTNGPAVAYAFNVNWWSLSDGPRTWTSPGAAPVDGASPCDSTCFFSLLLSVNPDGSLGPQSIIIFKSHDIPATDPLSYGGQLSVTATNTGTQELYQYFPCADFNCTASSDTYRTSGGGVWTQQQTVPNVPEPNSLVSLVVGLAGAATFLRRHRVI